MNTHYAHVPLALLLPLLLFTGCLDFESTTVVHRDGTLTRTVVVTGDSAEIAAGDFPLVIDSTWRFTRDTTAEGRSRLTAEQSFEDAAALTAALHTNDRLALRVTVQSERSFNWFSDIYEYTETWHRFDPFDRVPVTDFLSPSEIALAKKYGFGEGPYEVPGDSLALEDIGARFEEWRRRNMFASFYEVFEEGLRRIDDATLSPGEADAARERLYPEVADALEQGSVERATAAVIRILGSPDAAAAFEANAAGLAQFRERLRFSEEVWKHDYSVRVRMPGFLLDANASTLEGNTVSWNDFINLCYFEDVELYARSQALNWWLITLTLVVTALLLTVVIAGLIRLRKNAAPGDEKHARRSTPRI